MNFTPTRIHQQDYKRAALDIQKNLDELAKLILTVNRPLNISSRVAELMIDSSLAIDGKGRLYVKTPGKITQHYRWAEDAEGNLGIEHSADGSTNWTWAATVVGL